jgi:hypothetical protein
MSSTGNIDLWKRSSEIFKSLEVESDRGCILVVGSLVENALEKHISARLIPKADKDDELMSRSTISPISTFSAKINLAYRLGIIPPHERKIYHQLRELRNTCAHQIDQQDFEKLHFKDRVKNIIRESEFLWEVMRTKLAPSLFPDNEPESIGEFVEKIGWRTSFEAFFSMVIAHKEISIERITRVQTLYESAAGNVDASQKA